jgi:hypothetical protein
MSQHEPTGLTPLEGTLQALAEHFNTHIDCVRFLALLSPT